MKVFHRATTILVLIAIVGCSTPNNVRNVVPSQSSVTYTHENDGLKISIDPIFDSQQSISYFGIDAIAEGILPIHVRAENMNPNASFLFQKENVILTAGSGSDSSVTTVNTRSTSGDVIGSTGVALLSAPLLLASAIVVGNSNAVQYNFARLELKDQALLHGESTEGFAYFKIQKGTMPTRGILKISAVDLHSRKNTQMEVPINHD